MSTAAPTFLQGHRGRFHIEVRMLDADQKGQLCLNCERIGHVHGDPRRGWCTVYGVLRGNTHQVICPHYKTKEGK